MSLLASCWCPEEVGLQVTFEELHGWWIREASVDERFSS